MLAASKTSEQKKFHQVFMSYDVMRAKNVIFDDLWCVAQVLLYYFDTRVRDITTILSYYHPKAIQFKAAENTVGQKRARARTESGRPLRKILLQLLGHRAPADSLLATNSNMTCSCCLHLSKTLHSTVNSQYCILYDAIFIDSVNFSLPQVNVKLLGKIALSNQHKRLFAKQEKLKLVNQSVKGTLFGGF